VEGVAPRVRAHAKYPIFSHHARTAGSFAAMGWPMAIDDALSETAYAKINLALHVRRRRDDGYHDLETLFAFVDAGDGLSARFASQDELHVHGEFAAALGDPFGNIVARALSVLPHPGGLAISLDKRLPVAAGLGGGSADAGAIFRLIARTCGLPDDWRDRAARLGADVPACVESVTCIGREHRSCWSIRAFRSLPVRCSRPGTGSIAAPFRQAHRALSHFPGATIWRFRQSASVPQSPRSLLRLNKANPGSFVCPAPAPRVLRFTKRQRPCASRRSGLRSNSPVGGRWKAG